MKLKFKSGGADPPEMKVGGLVPCGPPVPLPMVISRYRSRYFFKKERRSRNRYWKISSLQ